MNRQGQPSPLIFHLGMATIAYQQALLSAPGAHAPEFPWHERLRAQADDSLIPEPLELAAEAGLRLRHMLQGISAWQAHPYRRPQNGAPVIWSQGSTRLLDYSAGSGGPPVLVIPSLINRARVLDLMPECSFMHHLASRDLRPFLLDWGAPGFAERSFDFTAYASDRLLPALAIVQALTRSNVALAGYCMGGTLAAGVAARRPQGIAALVTLGAPWAFAGERGIAGLLRTLARGDATAKAEVLLDSLAAAFGLIPADLFQHLFAVLNPVQAARKFRRFAALDPASDAANKFVALEDWLADGVPMALPAAKNLLLDWQAGNQPAKGEWQFIGGRVDPRTISVPSLHVTGSEDHIAPPQSAAPLAAAIPGAAAITVQCGHVGLIVGAAAPAGVWSPVSEFLLQNRG